MSPSKLIPTSLNRYHLIIDDHAALIDVESFIGDEELSQPYRYCIDFTSPSEILPDSILLKRVTFTLNDPTLPLIAAPVVLRSVYGMITGFEQISTSADETHYRVTLEPELALLRNTRRSAVYQNVSIPELAEKILRDLHGFEGWKFNFTLKNVYPRHEQLIQWDQSDLDYVLQLLAEVGIWFRFEMNTELDSEQIVFGDDQQHYQFNHRLPIINQSGLSDNSVETVWDLCSEHRVVTDSVRLKTYNYRDARSPLLAETSLKGTQSATEGKAYHYGFNYLSLGTQSDPDTNSGYFLSKLGHEQRLNQQVVLSGHANAAGLIPGQMVELEGDMPVAFSDGILITGMTVGASREKHYSVTFKGIPYSETVGFRPVVPVLPEIKGTVAGRITSVKADDIYAHLNEFGRYRAKFDFDLDSWTPGYESLWLRQAKVYAGDTYGLDMPLIEGAEVAIGFEGGDPNRPYIAHAKHNSARIDLITQENNKRNVLRTPANNKLRFDDTRGKEHGKLATEYGKSQINIGHLVDNAHVQRGEGLELRTDDFGAVRAAKGLLMSAYEQSKASGDVTDSDTALDQIARLNQQLESLSDAAKQADALVADIHAQIGMYESRLKPLNEIVLLVAPQGIALASGEHLQLTADQNIMMSSGKNMDIGVWKRLTLQVGEKLGIYALKGGLSFKVNQGKIDIQAQNDAMRLDAKGTIKLTSTDDEVIFAAKKKITLNAGGSYLTLQEGKVEYGTNGEYKRLTKHHGLQNKGAIVPTLLSPASPVILRTVDPITLQPVVSPVFAKSCLKEKGCTDAGTSQESADNFGETFLFSQSMPAACCGIPVSDLTATDDSEVVEHAQSAKRHSATSTVVGAGALAAGTTALAMNSAPLTEGLTQIGGRVALGEAIGSTGFLGTLEAIPWIGVLASALYIPGAGEGSDQVPGRDEYWYEQELRSKAFTGAKAKTRVRFWWQADASGQMHVYGVHTEDQDAGVSVAQMKWIPELGRYESDINDDNGPTITWTPGSPPKPDVPSHTGHPAPTIDQPTILVNPIPTEGTESTTTEFPVPDEKDFNDYILVFPAGTGILPIYVYLKTARDEPGVASGKGEVLTGTEKWLEAASSGVGAPIPAQVADKLRGQSFRNFNHFRSEFWHAVSESPELMKDFKPSNQTLIKLGLAPYPVPSEQVGGRTTFELHHEDQIQYGGEVFNMDKIKVTTPRSHIEIHKNAHK